MPLDKISAFFQRDRNEKVMLVKSNIRHLSRKVVKRLELLDLGRVLNSRLAAPKVFKSSGKFFISYRPDADCDFNKYPELSILSEKWVLNNKENNAADIARLYSLVLNMNQIISDGVQGDFAELGVYRGNSAFLLAHYARFAKRSLFLFDTYSGFEKKDLVGGDLDKPTAFEKTSLSLVRGIVGEDSVSYIEGHFPGTITEDIANRTYAAVHLDCDLYEPMKAGIEFFYPRMTSGGIMIIHDYANPCWDGVRRATDGFFNNSVPERPIILPDKSGTAIIRKCY